MSSGLAVAVIACSLVLAAGCLLTAARDRAPGRVHLAGAAVVEAVLLAQVVVAVVRLAGGERPGSLVTFVGYLVAAPLLLPAAAALAALERTRWGAVILGVAALVLPVLMLRLQQLWHG
ncbi:MAG TPA: hypothetical protein VFM55_23395 [Micromonosporaceae bacterium]|nr:hypothetical protein [Micromonosporaceae bacterium]